MKLFLRKASIGDDFSVMRNRDEYSVEYAVKYGDFVLTGCADCPQTLQTGQLRVSLNAGFKLDDFIGKYNSFNDSQIGMLKKVLPNFMGWLINTAYDKEVDFVHYCRTEYSSSEGNIWFICNIIELESERSIIEGIIDLSYMAAKAIEEIKNSSIPFAKSQYLLDTDIRNQMDVVEDFIRFCQR